MGLRPSGYDPIRRVQRRRFDLVFLLVLMLDDFERLTISRTRTTTSTIEASNLSGHGGPPDFKKIASKFMKFHKSPTVGREHPV